MKFFLSRVMISWTEFSIKFSLWGYLAYFYTYYSFLKLLRESFKPEWVEYDLKLTKPLI